MGIRDTEMNTNNENFDEVIEKVKSLEARVYRLEKSSLKVTSKGEDDNPKDSGKTKDLDFSINIRAFVNEFVAGKSGAKKFTLLLAYLVKGEVGKSIKLSVIDKNWNTMKGKGLLGNSNRLYSNQAKTQGWVDSPERGMYCLADKWYGANEQEQQE